MIATTVGFAHYISGHVKEYCSQHNIKIIEVVSPYIVNYFQKVLGINDLNNSLMYVCMQLRINFKYINCAKQEKYLLSIIDLKISYWNIFTQVEKRAVPLAFRAPVEGEELKWYRHKIFPHW